MSSQAHKQAIGHLKIHMKEKKFYMEKTTVSNGSGYEQTQGYELWTHMLTFKLFDSSKPSWMKKNIY